MRVFIYFRKHNSGQETMTLTKGTLRKAARAVTRIARNLGRTKRKEKWLHGVLLGYLEARVGNMRSEWQVPRGRIDLRHGGTNPSVIELVVRQYGVEDKPAMNKKELGKLCRVTSARARTRFLLILDPSGKKPVEKERLRKAYARYNGGRGKFERQPVRIMYVHPESKNDFDFSWSPYLQ